MHARIVDGSAVDRAFGYVSEEDVYICPAGDRLTYYFTTQENGLALHRWRIGVRIGSSNNLARPRLPLRAPRPARYVPKADRADFIGTSSAKRLHLQQGLRQVLSAQPRQIVGFHTTGISR